MKFFILKFLFCSYIIDARIDVNTNSGLSTIDLEQYPELITEASSTAPSKTNQMIEPMTNTIESVRLETEQNFPDGKITTKEYYHTLTNRSFVTSFIKSRRNLKRSSQKRSKATTDSPSESDF